MGLTLARANLLSRSIRSSISGSGLTRKLNLKTSLGLQNTTGANTPGGFVGKIFGSIMPWGKKFGGFITSQILSGIQFTVVEVLQYIRDFAGFVNNFDWRASDNEYIAQMDARNTALAGQWGGVLGSAAGWVVGIAVGSAATVACPVIGSGKLASIAAGNAALEGLEEIGARTAQGFIETSKVFAANGWTNFWRVGRRLAGFNPPDEAPVSSLKNFFENKDETKGPSAGKEFRENFLDDFWESFVEAGYIFAYELDSQLAAVRTANAGGVKRTVKLTPDRQAPNEAIVFTGGQDQVKTMIQTTIAQHRMLYNRDVGQIVGMPAEDWYKAKPQRRKLTIEFRDIEKPPFRKPNGKRVKMTTCAIPEPKSNLSWATIKRAAKPYNWGRFRCTANLTNGRQMAVYGATAQEAENKLRDLLELSTCEISTVSITEEKQRNPKLKKESVRVYPYLGTMLVRKPNIGTGGRTDLDGNSWDEAHATFELWTDTEPLSFDNVRW